MPSRNENSGGTEREREGKRERERERKKKSTERIFESRHAGEPETAAGL